MNLVPFDPAHALAMRVQPNQSLPRGEFLRALSTPAGEAYTGMVDGRPIGCAGVVEMWQGRALAWALLSEDAGPHMIAVTRAIRFFLGTVPFRRVEMAVDAEFPAAIRWAEMLGFERETPEPMRAYTPDGRACYQYARVK